MWFFVLSVKGVFEAYSPCELFKILQELLPDFTSVCQGCSDGFETLSWHADMTVRKLMV